MTTQHTPGPWRIDSGRHGIHIRAGKPTDPLGGDLVLATFNYANARLIAKAPDLKAALAWALDQIEDDLDPDHQAALAHARFLLED